MTRLRHWLAAALLLTTSALAHAADTEAEAFLAAWANPGTTDTGDSSTLTTHPLYPWLQATRLKNALLAQEADAPLRADALLAQAGDLPYGRELRRARLNQLAAAQDHKTFLALWRDSASNDALECLYFDARRASGDKTVAESIAKRWVTSSATVLPECSDSYGWLKRQSAYTPELVEKRLRARLLDNDAVTARSLVADVAEPKRKRYEAWVKMLADPAGELNRLAKGPAQALDGDGLADVWLRWAKNNATDANGLLPRFVAAQGLSLTDVQTLQRNTALALAWNRDAAAIPLFKQVPDRLLEERGQEWRIRSALWAGDWNLAFNWLSLLPDDMAAQPRWRYWTARALEATGQQEEADSRYRSLTKETDTYGLFAAWRSGKGWTPTDMPYPMTAEQRAVLEENPAYVRARAAWSLDLKPIASAEWRYAYDTLPVSARASMIRAAAGLGWYDQAIVTATRVGQFGDLSALFPRPYERQVKAASEASGIPDYWLWAVMRRESAFNADVVSSAGAVGLLQMLPSTAQATAKSVGLLPPDGEALKNPGINLPLGAAHLKEVLDKSNGRWQMALAAYNAGFKAVSRWRPAENMDADIWIENIPFNETRAYVQRIVFHAAVYQWLDTQRPVRANNWLPPVEPAAP
jgi:soluble lytic murein transglycosylase